MENPYKIGFYIRVSTEEQAENPEGSIKNQEQRLREMVKFKNSDRSFGEIAGVFIDRAKSGKDTNRPELQRLLSAIRLGEINYVMVSELSRISRNIRDFAEIWEMMQKIGCGFQSLRENFDTTTAAGEMVLYSMANIAQFERRQVSERVKANVNARASRGLYSGGSVTIGYRVVPEKPGYLEPDPEMASVVQEAFRAFLKEGTLSHAARFLNEKGIKLRRNKQGGGRFARLEHFTVDNLHQILRNITYAGQKKYRSREGVKLAKAVWEPIVDEKTFAKTQELLSKNCRRKKPPKDTWYPYVLTGLTSCGECGNTMVGKSAHGKMGKVGYYEHSWATKRDSTLTKKIFKCDPHRVLAKKIEPFVWEEVKKLILSPNRSRELLDEAIRIHQENSVNQERERLKAKIFGWSSQIEALAERLSQIPKSVSATPIFKQMEKLEVLKAEAEGKLFELDGGMTNAVPPVDIETYERYLGTLRKFVNTDADSKIKTKVIAKLVHKVQVLKEGIRIHYNVSKEHFKGELEKSSSPSFFVPQMQINAFEEKLVSRCSNTLTFGARRGT